MKNCLDCIKNEKFLWFVSGAAALILGKKVLKSESARKACVKTMAKAMKLQSEAQEAFQNMKEDAEDICFDAKADLEKEAME